MAHFQHIWGPWRGPIASKWAPNGQMDNFTCLCTPKGQGSLLKKHVFDPFLTHFGRQKGPFCKHFGIFHGPKSVSTGSKRAKNKCLSIPSGLGTTLEKSFFAPGSLLHPLFAPPNDHWQGSLAYHWVFLMLGTYKKWRGGLQSPRPCRPLHIQSHREPAELGLEVCETCLLFRRQSLLLSLSLLLLLRPHLMHFLPLQGRRGLAGDTGLAKSR